MASTPSHGEQVHRLPRVAGLGYGLIYSLAFGLAAWGYDGRVLAHSNAELAWAKLGVGLPLLLLVGAATGALAGRSARAGAWIRAWMAGGALMGIIVGAMPFAGHNLATWVTEPRLWGTNVYPMGPAGAAQMAFVAFVTACVGSIAGLLGCVLLEKASHLASPAGRMSGRSWAVLFLGVPLAVLPGLTGDQIVNSALRTGQRTVYGYTSTGPAGDTSHGDVDPYRDQPAASFTLHLVDYDLETQEQETIDVAFDNGSVVRCQVSSRELGDCLPISPQFETWMDALVQGREPAPQSGGVVVNEQTLSWLASQREHMSERYEVARDTQRGGWVIMSARFDSGYALTCYFRGASPVVLDRCSGNQER